MLDGRKSRILALIIESYIATGEPVGSKLLADMLENCVSSATIRNDMVALTAAGFLEQPHTSAGRLPTAQAYRLYVEQLMEHRPLPRHEARLIEGLLGGTSGDATRLLEDACRALADLTGVAAFASRPEVVNSSISRIDVMQMSPRNMAVVLALDNGILRTRMCRCQRDIPSRLVVALADYMCRRFLNKPLEAITVPAMQEIILELGELGLAVAPILSALYELVQECADTKVVYAGQLNLLRYPEYTADQVQGIIGLLTRQELPEGLFAQPNEDGIQILAGGDNVPELKDSCILLTRYRLGERGHGVLGVIGPTRMDYAAVVPRLEYFARIIGQSLSELFEESEALDMR